MAEAAGGPDDAGSVPTTGRPSRGGGADAGGGLDEVHLRDLRDRPQRLHEQALDVAGGDPRLGALLHRRADDELAVAGGEVDARGPHGPADEDRGALPAAEPEDLSAHPAHGHGASEPSGRPARRQHDTAGRRGLAPSEADTRVGAAPNGVDTGRRVAHTRQRGRRPEGRQEQAAITLRQISALLAGQVRALAWSLIRARLSDRSFDNPDLPGRARVNNVDGTLS